MVASPNTERPDGQGSDYLTNKIAELERRLNELSAQSKFPFAIMRSGNKEFSVELSEDGLSTDLIIGNGIGGVTFETFTSPTYGGKGWRLFDYAGTEMVASDTSAGFGLGQPSLPFVFSGWESLNLTGATNTATATTIGQGQNVLYNPSVYVSPRIRLVSTTNETIKHFVQWQGVASGLFNSTERTVALVAGVPQIITPDFIGMFAAGDMKLNAKAFFKMYCTTAAPANVSATLAYNLGYGASKAFYDGNPVAH